MTSWNGWAGTILNVDLTTMKVSRETLSREFAINYIGGSGFGARILYDEVGPGDNALEPENVIIIGQGPLSATAAPSGGRYDLISKSPLTGIYCRSNGGGLFGPELKWAGYDLIVIRGKAEKPVYLWIEDEHVELRDATHLWGKDTWTTQRMIREELGDPEIQVLKIGPAGENLCYSSCVIGGLLRAASRWSFGAVWGSKRLKAVAVRGSKAVNIAKPKEFMELCMALLERVKRDPLYPLHSTAGGIGTISDPALRRGHWASPLNTTTLHSSYFKPLFDKNLACFGCPVHCSHYFTVKSGKYKGTVGEGPEASSVLRCSQMGVGDAAFVCKVNSVCNQLGLTTDIFTAIAWAMDLYQDGIITKGDTDGLELMRGNQDVILELLPKIAYKEGFGEIVDAYPIRAAEKLGRGSELYIGHIKGGIGGGAAEILRSMHRALGYGVSTRGQDHLMGAPSVIAPGLRKEIPDDLLERLGKERYNDPTIFLKPFSSDPTEALLVYDEENLCTLCDMTGVCKFVSEHMLFVEGIHLKDFVQLLSTATGMDFSAADLVKAAERELMLERAYNAREGIRRIDDYPYAFYYQLKHGEKHPRFDYSAFKYSIEDYNQVLDEYYRLHGCDQQTGIPTREKLEALGLKDVADDLEHRGILSHNI